MKNSLCATSILLISCLQLGCSDSEPIPRDEANDPPLGIPSQPSGDDNSVSTNALFSIDIEEQFMNTPFELMAEFNIGATLTETRRAPSALDEPQLTSVLATGFFRRQQPPTTPQQIEDSVVNSLDQCTRYEQGVPVEGYVFNLPDRPALDLTMDGGEVVTVSSGAGSYTDLLKNTAGDSIFYRDNAAGQAPFPIPLGLLLNSPGADFPSIADAPFHDIVPLDLLGAPEFDEIDSATFTWVPTVEIYDWLLITIAGTGSAGQLPAVLCTVADDGNFEIPAWAMQGIDSSDVGITRSMVRQQERYSVQANVLFKGITSTLVASNLIRQLAIQ